MVFVDTPRDAVYIDCMDKETKRLIIGKVGSIKNLAETLGVNVATVYGWKRIPMERAAQISARWGIPKHKLRPDIWRPKKKWNPSPKGG